MRTLETLLFLLFLWDKEIWPSKDKIVLQVPPYLVNGSNTLPSTLCRAWTETWGPEREKCTLKMFCLQHLIGHTDRRGKCKQKEWLLLLIKSRWINKGIHYFRWRQARAEREAWGFKGFSRMYIILARQQQQKPKQPSVFTFQHRIRGNV